jgi:hypothetical protein
MKIDSKLKDRLAKLLALSKSDNEHEAASAQSRIEKLCKLHNVNIDDLFGCDEQVTMHWFKYRDSYSERVLLNVIWRVTNIQDGWANPMRPNQTGVQCTASQAAEISLWWGVLQRAFLIEMNTLLLDFSSAFIRANKLYGESDLEVIEDEVDWERERRVARLATGITATPVFKGLISK